MFCPNCGSQMMDGTIFCTNCGSPMTPRSMIVRGNRVITALQDPLFLVICILQSVSALVHMIIGFYGVIPVLFTVFLWIVFAKAKRGETPQKQLRCISGVVYAEYIVSFVLSGLMLLAGTLILVLGVTFPFASGGLPELGNFAWEYLPEQYGRADYVFSTLLFVIIGLVLIVTAGATIALNILGYRRIHRFAKSVYENAYEDVQLPDAKAARIWLMIFGIASAAQIPSSFFTIFISSVVSGGIDGASIMAIVASGCSAAMTILAGVLVKKYYCKAKTVPGIPEEI